MTKMLNHKTVYNKDIILILAASFFYMASPMLVTPLITGFTESIGGTAAMMGFVGGLMNLVSLFCRPLAGNLADKMSKYRLSVIGVICMIIAAAGYVAAPNAAAVVVARVVNGIGFACCSVCMSTWMSNLLPKEKIGSGMGFYGSMNALAMAVAPAVGVNVYSRYGYRAAFLIALVFAAAVFFIIQFVKDKGVPSEQTRAKKNSVKQFRPVDAKVLPISLIIMLFAIPYCATQSFLVTYTSERMLNVSVGMFFPAYAVVLILLRLSLKNYFDKLPFRIFLAVSCVSEFLSMCMLTVMRGNAAMFLASALLAGGYGIMCSVCQSTAMLLAGKENRGLANSTYYIGLDLGMTLGPMIGGLLYGSLEARFFYPALFATMPLAGLVYVTMAVKDKIKKSKIEKQNV